MRLTASFIILPVFIIMALLGLDPGASSFYFSSAASKDDSLLSVKLKEKAIFHNDFCRNVFFTWTTKKQIAELESSKTLLSRSKSETKGYSIYDLSLRDSSLKNNGYSKLLQGDRFSKKRFCWPDAWATVMGWEDEK